MHRRSLLLAFVTSALSAGAVFAQLAANLPRFEVASIRVNTSGDSSSGNDFLAASVTFRNYTLRGIIRTAFAVDDLSLEAPGWVGDVRLDITAKVPGPVTLEQRRQMLQALLQERLGLAVHRTSVSRPGFALVLAKGGVRIAPVEDVGEHMNDMRDGNIKMVRTTISNFAEALGFKLRQPVVDETRLSGVYNVTLRYAPDRGAEAAGADEGPSMFKALEEQLGLKLEARKLPVEVLVVDHCEKVPTEN